MHLRRTFALAVCLSLWSTVVFAEPNLPALEELGKRVFFQNISEPARMSCSTCHAPANGWTGGVAGINLGQVAVTGANPHKVGGRKPPSAAYATFSPNLELTEACWTGPGRRCKGGVFWDGRATGTGISADILPTGYEAYAQFLGPTADQALGPFANSAEQNVPVGEDEELAGAGAVCRAVEGADYAELYELAWGEPIGCDGEQAETVFQRLAASISAWEHSTEVNSFSSRFDFATENEAFPFPSFTDQENEGFAIFFDLERGKCVACHNSVSAEGDPQVFSDQSFHNIGLPPNREVANFSPTDPDEGLAEFTEMPNHVGDFRTPTLRNVARAVGVDFPKAYMHNGYFKSLEDVVHFYNTAAAKQAC